MNVIKLVTKRYGYIMYIYITCLVAFPSRTRTKARPRTSTGARPTAARAQVAAYLPTRLTISKSLHPPCKYNIIMNTLSFLNKLTTLLDYNT